MSLKDNIKVMVVDDMSTSRGLLMNALYEVGVKNVTFEVDGEKALKSLTESPVHIVISDYNMPGLDGIGLLEGLRANAATKRIGFILVTGTHDMAVVKKAHAAGMNNYLKKPFTPQSLKACIEQVTGPL